MIAFWWCVSAVLVPMFAVAFYIRLVNKRNERFENPLTKSFRRPAGAQLGRELGREQMELAFSLVEVTLFSVLPVFLYLYYSKMGAAEATLLHLILCVVVWVGFLGFTLYRLAGRIDNIRKLRLGYECELVVGQELDQLMRSGYSIFHDVQAEGFNIDHVVVGSNGVFAIETKGRSKRANSRGKGKAEYKVNYENGVLQFPGWHETKPIKQAELQSQWLSQWLSKSTGAAIETKPVVILPGWFVNSKVKQKVPVLAGGQIIPYFTSQSGNTVTPQHCQQLIHQLDQRVRDLKPGEMVRPLPE